MNPNHQVMVREDTGRVRVRTVNDMPSQTKASQVQDAEIKNILARYEQTGVLVGLRQVDLAFHDVSEFEDFADLMRQSKVAEAEFMKLPAAVRKAFDHDHHVWLDAAHDGLSEAQTEYLTKIGAIKAVETPQERPAPPVPTPAPES